jgi:hypothetical protein
LHIKNLKYSFYGQLLIPKVAFLGYDADFCQVRFLDLSYEKSAIFILFFCSNPVFFSHFTQKVYFFDTDFC